MNTLQVYFAQLGRAFAATDRFESLRGHGVARPMAADLVFEEFYAGAAFNDGNGGERRPHEAPEQAGLAAALTFLIRMRSVQNNRL